MENPGRIKSQNKDKDIEIILENNSLKKTSLKITIINNNKNSREIPSLFIFVTSSLFKLKTFFFNTIPF